MEDKINSVVWDVANRFEFPGDHRDEICRRASIILDEKYKINCVATPYARNLLIAALDNNC
jgi:hypothetical protein